MLESFQYFTARLTEVLRVSTQTATPADGGGSSGKGTSWLVERVAV